MPKRPPRLELTLTEIKVDGYFRSPVRDRSIAAVATLILIAKVIDAMDDLVFGYVIDRINPTQLKFLSKLAGSGKYLPWYRATFSLLPLSVVLFFAMPGGLPEGAKLVWFAVAYLIFDLACTPSQVPMTIHPRSLG